MILVRLYHYIDIFEQDHALFLTVVLQIYIKTFSSADIETPFNQTVFFRLIYIYTYIVISV